MKKLFPLFLIIISLMLMLASCNVESETPGIVYDYSEDGTYALVIDYTGTAARVRIADEYEGLTVKTIYSEAFKNKSITSVIIPDSVTSIGDSAFYNCYSLTSVTIGNGVTSIGNWAFYYCSSLTSVTIGNGVTSIGDDAFSYCTRLTSVTIPDSVTIIGSSAFYNCKSLTGVYITDIAAWCDILFINLFANPSYYAGNLYLNGELVTELVIPDSVTSIGYMAFYNCDSLTSVTIGKGVTSIGEYSFNACKSLRSIKYRGTEAEWEGITKGDSWKPYSVTVTYNYDGE